MTEETLLQLEIKAYELMASDRLYHDVAHVKNVVKFVTQLLESEGGDRDIVITACLFHDIARDQDNHEMRGAEQLKGILEQINGFPKEKIEPVCLAVEHHENGQVTHEEKIVSDADKMDAFTPLGIGRGFMMCAKKGMMLKQTIEAYLSLLETWYNGMHFEMSKKLISADYSNTKQLLENMKAMY